MSASAIPSARRSCRGSKAISPSCCSRSRPAAAEFEPPELLGRHDDDRDRRRQRLSRHPRRAAARSAAIEAAEQVEGVTVFHAGTAHRRGALVASGGRVLAVTAVAETLRQRPGPRLSGGRRRSTSPTASTAATSAGASWSGRHEPHVYLRRSGSPRRSASTCSGTGRSAPATGFAAGVEGSPAPCSTITRSADVQARLERGPLTPAAGPVRARPTNSSGAKSSARIEAPRRRRGRLEPGSLPPEAAR